MLAYTKNLAAYTKLSSENQQVKLQCMQCMQKLKIKIVKGEHFLCPPFGYQMMKKILYLQEGATNPIQNETCSKKMTLLSVWLLILFFSHEDTAIVCN